MNAIRQLLAAIHPSALSRPIESSLRSPETYAGHDRMQNFASPGGSVLNEERETSGHSGAVGRRGESPL